MITTPQACAECPASYDSDPASELLCSLWLELENKQQEAAEAAEAGEAGPSDTESGGSDLISTMANLAPVSCLYGEHTTSADNRCDLWCQIQLLEVSLCHNY